MGKIPINIGGGAGSGSDDCTATAADILASKTAIYNGSDDEAEKGTMADYSGTTTQASGSMNSSSSRVEYTVPNTGKYDTAAKLYLPYSTMRSLIGYTDASKVLSGTTICGLAGTMTNVASIDPAKSQTVSDSTLYVRMTNGAHVTNASSGYPEVSVPQADLASTIGLTADKLVVGNTVLGISGTQYSKGAAYAGSLYFYGTSIVAGARGNYFNYTSNGTSYDNSGDVVISLTPGQAVIWAFTGSTVPLGSYSTFHVRIRQISGNGDSLTLRFLYSTNTTSTTGYTDSTISPTYSMTDYTINVSSYSGSYYVGVRFSITNSTSGAHLYLIDHIWLT